jgi:hypothetical protein
MNTSIVRVKSLLLESESLVWRLFLLTVASTWEGESFSPLDFDENKCPIELHLDSLSIDRSRSQRNTKWK